MGLEGAVRLGFRRELEAVEDPEEREALSDRMVDRAYQHGKALNVATAFEIDDVIDPADHPAPGRRDAAGRPPPRPGRERNAPASTPGSHRHLAMGFRHERRTLFEAVVRN